MPAAGCRAFSELIDTSDPALAQLSAGVFGDDERAVEAHVDDGPEIRRRAYR